MVSFRKGRTSVNGLDIVHLTAGRGDPLIFLHGAGTFTGFDFARAWAETRRVIVPYHPNFGESADAPGFDEMQDYVMHLLDLLDALGIATFDLVGQSMGGWMAAKFASQHNDRVRRLVLACPYGLRVPAHPTRDLFTIAPAELPSVLAADPATVTRHLPKGKDVEFAVQRYREQTAMANMVWERPFDPKLLPWLHRLTMPTLILWGRADRLIPHQQSKVWAERIPGARIKLIAGAGHLMFDESAAAVDAVGRFLDGRQR